MPWSEKIIKYVLSSMCFKMEREDLVEGHVLVREGVLADAVDAGVVADI